MHLDIVLARKQGIQLYMYISNPMNIFLCQPARHHRAGWFFEGRSDVFQSSDTIRIREE